MFFALHESKELYNEPMDAIVHDWEKYFISEFDFQSI